MGLRWSRCADDDVDGFAVWSGMATMACRSVRRRVEVCESRSRSRSRSRQSGRQPRRPQPKPKRVTTYRRWAEVIDVERKPLRLDRKWAPRMAIDDRRPKTGERNRQSPIAYHQPQSQSQSQRAP
ncbi:uncharacterized protein LOC143914729 [Arctopsyche grandis]|uniref:uncharacterized protein LOC143914729 n=1 Tax=Arctopsyche grandis TaxID=121162 RepID=UPI00406D6DF0